MPELTKQEMTDAVANGVLKALVILMIILISLGIALVVIVRLLATTF
jgi:hypothetical protein